MAERVGFEPTVPLQVHLISNQARSTWLRHLSEGAEASRISSISATRTEGLVLGGELGLIRRPRALVLACGTSATGLAWCVMIGAHTRASSIVTNEAKARRGSGAGNEVRTRSSVGRIDLIWRAMT